MIIISKFVMLCAYLCQAAKAPIIRSSWGVAPIPSDLFNLKSEGKKSFVYCHLCQPIPIFLSLSFRRKKNVNCDLC